MLRPEYHGLTNDFGTDVFLHSGHNEAEARSKSAKI
jgi:hypothetical protein